MVLTIGQMRQTVIFKINTPTISATADREAVTTGGINDSYSTLLTTRGRLRKHSGHRALMFGVIESSESYELICRFQLGIDNNLRVDTKIDIGNFRYTMNGLPEKIDELNHLYKFNLSLERQFAVNSTPIADGAYGPASYGVFKLQKILLDGDTSVQDADLIPAAGLTITILMVSRSSDVYSQTVGTPGNLEFKYTTGTGVVEFDPASPGNIGGELIEIIYKLT